MTTLYFWIGITGGEMSDFHGMFQRDCKSREHLQVPNFIFEYMKMMCYDRFRCGLLQVRSCWGLCDRMWHMCGQSSKDPTLK